MKLGISSLGYLVNYGAKGNYENLNELLLQATESALEFTEKWNLATCEIILEPPKIREVKERKAFIELCNSYSVEKQIHGNFIDVSLCSFNEWITRATVDAYVDNARICAEIGAKIFTIHPGPADFPIPPFKEKHNKILLNSVEKLLDEVKDLEIAICIENMPKDAGFFLTIEEIEEFFIKLNREDLFFTYDTSHLWTNNGDPNVLWNKFHDKIKNVHLAENSDKNTDHHPQLGTGKVNFEEIFNIMKSYKYLEAIIVEVFSATTLEKSIEYITQFL
ncbi:MAG: sugar phosphate isomerase/epimerase family protein [Promethearchaeota archaeon]